jgi:P4 family phage/plasmid primase-like protien
MSAITPLQSFLLRTRVGKGCEFTHTSFARPAGAFYVSGDHEDAFNALYKSAIEAGEEVHLCEKHKDLAPLLVDIDLRFPLPIAESSSQQIARSFTVEDVQRFVRIYLDAMAELLVLPTTLDVYVMTKPHPTRNQLYVKDGIHIMVPEVVTTDAVQLMCRKSCLEKVAAWASEVGAINEAKDVYDESVLSRNNWIMYGSCKPDACPYSVEYVLRFRTDDGSCEEVATQHSRPELIDLLSIRNKYNAAQLQPRAADAVREREEEECERSVRRQQRRNHPALRDTENDEDNECANLEVVKKLVDVLSPARSQTYDDWMRVGWCLRNIDHRLLESWVKFSRLSPKYVEGECEDKWNHMRCGGGLGMGTLCMWAREDAPELYPEITRQDLRRLINASRTGTHCDVARVVHHMYDGRYVCASLRNRTWYEFRNHRWRVSDGACSLRKALSNEVWREYKNMAAELIRMSLATDDEELQKKYSQDEKQLLGVAEKLKVYNYKENVMKECAEHFYVEKFEERLDSACHLIGFENGVYDLEADEFRPGRPDDFITFSTGIDYQPYDPNHPCVAEIHRFMSQVQPKPHMAKYCLVLLASFLSGSINEERFHIWTGSGGNGKSRLIELMESCFGDYSCKFPVTMLTQKRVASNAANSELARAKGKRMAVMQEPSEDEKLNIGLMKELSGGDKIIARSLYSMPIEFKPQFHMLLMCNHLPHVDANDGGTWRRVRVVEFRSRFVSNPNPMDENEFPIDLELAKKFDRWRPHFIGMMLDYYRLYMVEGLQEPEEVLACTHEYQKKNDFVADFMADTVDIVPNDSTAFVGVDELFEEFKEWTKTENMPMRLPRRKDIQALLEKRYGKATRMDGAFAFKNMRMREKNRA